MYTQEESKVIFSPWVMRSAWNKVLTWYSTGEWHDPAELLEWKADPWRRLADLSLDLSKGTYKPGPFPEIPYPKKGGYTRHYVMPSVRDQVASMVFMVLLGPFLEARMPNVSLGNRLYRPRVRKTPNKKHDTADCKGSDQTDDTRQSEDCSALGANGSQESPESDKAHERKRWFQAPFSLSHKRVYTGFPASYGLFRRLLQWLANWCVLGDEGADDSFQDLNGEDPDRLPYQDYLKKKMLPADLAYARLDLTMAFPSLDRSWLRDVMCALVKDQVEPGFCPEGSGGIQVRDWYTSYGRPDFPSLENRKSQGFKDWIDPYRSLTEPHPWNYLANSGDTRLKLVNRLMDMLDSISYLKWEVPDTWNDDVNSWFPCQHCSDIKECVNKLSDEDRGWVGPHGFAPLSSEEDICSRNGILNRNIGLPTGLAISGFLLNVALTPVDETMVTLVEQINMSSKGFEHCLFYLRFADDVVMLAKQPCDLEKAICEFRESLHRFAGDTLELNVSKIKPDGVKNFVEKYIRSESKNVCADRSKQRGGSCGTVIDKSPPSLQGYLHHSDYLTRANLELFTTEIVREMSEIADETLGERFGARGIERLEQLMELATLEIDDFEVGADARLSFAVNRLARASWPSGPVLREDRVVDPEVYVKRIMLIAETALRRHPWRFKLWSAILTIALRASCQFDAKGNKSAFGFSWLCGKVLPLLRWSRQGAEDISPSEASWEISCVVGDTYTKQDFRCEEMDKLRTAQTHRCRERTSFHRAEFWRQWTRCIQALQRIADGNNELSSSRGWPAFFTAEEARELVEQFGDIRKFAKILYGDWTWCWDERPFLWWWEAEALNAAALTVLSADGLSDEDVPLGAEAVLNSLGPPCPELMRMSDGPESFRNYVMAQQLSGIRDVQDRIRNVLKNTLYYDGCRDITMKNSSLPSSAKAVWLNSYFGCWNISKCDGEKSSKQKLALRVVPETDDWAWALLGRQSLWDSLFSLMDRIPATRFAPPPNLPGLDEVWLDFIRLEDYAVLRRLLMAHDLHVPIGLFQGWFPHLAQYMESDRTSQSQITLHHAVYHLDEDSSGFPRPSRVPAIGVEWHLAWKLWRTQLLNDHESDKKIIAPSTVVLNEDAFDDLVKFRKAELVDTNDREFYEVCWGDNPIETLSALTPDHPAPHPLFVIPLSFPRSEEDYYSPEKGALLLWLLEGCEKVLDQVFEFFPWHLPLVERDYVRARLMIPDWIWYWIETSFGIHSEISSDLFDQDDEAIILEFERLLENPWVRHIKLDTEGNWDLINPPSYSRVESVEVPSSYAKELNLRLVQGVEMPVYEEWLPLKARPSFVVNRDSMGRLWGEMASEIQAAYDEARVSAGSNEDQDGRIREDLVVFPEWYADKGSVRDFRQFCFGTGIGVLCGLLPTELPRAVPVVRQVRATGHRCLVNEAVLMIPGYEGYDGRSEAPSTFNETSSNDSAGSQRQDKKFHLPSKVYQFNIRKCAPSVSEVGLIKALEEATDNKWWFVCGNSWSCFHHPEWGGFTVTICSDVLTAGEWRDLYGHIMHLFILACNQDIDLFEQVTWTRGYELYVNSITVNHGRFGGTTVWTPKHSYHKEVFRVRGTKKGLSIVVSVPVESLAKAQKDQYQDSCEQTKREWLKVKDSSRKGKFKTPPPRVTYTCALEKKKRCPWKCPRGREQER